MALRAAALIRALDSYRIMRHSRTIKLLPTALLFAGLISAYQYVFAQSTSEDNLEVRVQKAAEGLLDSGVRLNSAYKEFRTIGEAAIPEILKLIKNDENQSPYVIGTRNVRLVSILAEYKGVKADEALIELLAHKQSFIRGEAVVSLGERKSKIALPYLVRMLDDLEIHLAMMVSHGDDYNILVRDVAIEAFQKITGKILAKRAGKVEQAKAWRRWWEKQQKSR